MTDNPKGVLPPGVLPNVFDTDPPDLNPATVIGNGFVGIDESKLPGAEKTKRDEKPVLEEPPKHRLHLDEKTDERNHKHR